MEIVLQAKSSYGIPDWDGIVELESLQLFQMKRLTNSRSTTALFRKILKILKGARSPLTLPGGIVPDDLDVGDFMQIVVGLTAVSKGRQVQRLYTCPHCNKKQPRVIDIIQVFKPEAPATLGGKASVGIGGEDKVLCQNVRIRDFLEVHGLAETLATESWKEKGPADLAYAKKEWGDVFPIEDEEDLEDFIEMLTDVGMVAVRLERGKESLQQRIKWLLGLKGEEIAVYGKLSEAVAGLSATMGNEYSTVCTECKKKFSSTLEVEDYFFGSRLNFSMRLS
jgi:hypothetical protein